MHAGRCWRLLLWCVTVWTFLALSSQIPACILSWIAKYYRRYIISGALLWGSSSSLRSSFSVALICSAAGATLWFLLLRSCVVHADTCTHSGCGQALAFSTAWQFRLYKPRWQKIRIVCYYNASLQWLERALFWLWEQSTVAIKERPSLPAELTSSPLTPFPSLFIYSKDITKTVTADLLLLEPGRQICLHNSLEYNQVFGVSCCWKFSISRSHSFDQDLQVCYVRLEWRQHQNHNTSVVNQNVQMEVMESVQ